MKKVSKPHLIYYLDELSILVLGIVTVIFSNALKKIMHGQIIAKKDIFINIWTLIGTCILAIGYYGSVHVHWKYNDSKKPSWIKRASVAISAAAACKYFTSEN